MSTNDRTQMQAMRLSLVMGFVMLVLKMSAYLLTGSAAILGDAAESVVHVAAVVFAAYSLWLAAQPAEKLEDVRDDTRLDPAFGAEGLARFQGDEPCQFFRMCLEDGRALVHQGATLARRHPGPVLLRARRLADGDVDVCRVAEGRLRHFGASGRVHHGEGLSTHRRHIPPSDEVQARQGTGQGKRIKRGVGRRRMQGVGHRVLVSRSVWPPSVAARYRGGDVAFVCTGSHTAGCSGRGVCYLSPSSCRFSRRTGSLV